MTLVSLSSSALDGEICRPPLLLHFLDTCWCRPTDMLLTQSFWVTLCSLAAFICPLGRAEQWFLFTECDTLADFTTADPKELSSHETAPLGLFTAAIHYLHIKQTSFSNTEYKPKIKPSKNGCKCYCKSKYLTVSTMQTDLNMLFSFAVFSQGAVLEPPLWRRKAQWRGRGQGSTSGVRSPEKFCLTFVLNCWPASLYLNGFDDVWNDANWQQTALRLKHPASLVLLKSNMYYTHKEDRLTMMHSVHDQFAFSWVKMKIRETEKNSGPKHTINQSICQLWWPVTLLQLTGPSPSLFSISVPYRWVWLNTKKDHKGPQRTTREHRAGPQSQTDVIEAHLSTVKYRRDSNGDETCCRTSSKICARW